MKTKIFLRMASVMMLLHALGHTMGVLTWKQAPNARVAGVIAGMLNEHFDFMSRSVSVGMFFEGYGISMIFVLLLLTVLLWQLANAPVKNTLSVMAIFLLALAVTEYIYFFPLAGTMTLVAGACTGLAGFQLKP